LPRSKIPKHTEDTQGNDEHLHNDGINADYYTSVSAHEGPGSTVVDEHEQAPEGINTDVFYNPRIAKILGGKTNKGSKPSIEMKKSEKVPHSDSMRPSDLKDTLSDPETLVAIAESATRKTTDKEVADLATDIAKKLGSSSVSTL
jgi:aarF domain-containing kinase